MNYGKENETLEFKKSTSELNDGTVIGQKDITESTLRDISISIAEGIKPQVIPEISMELINDKTIIRVSVKGSANIYSAFDKYYIRSFDEDKKVSHQLIIKVIKGNMI